MPFNLPTLDELRLQIGADIETWLPGTRAKTRRSVLGVIGFAQAGAVQGLHAHLDYLYRNFLPDELADAEGVERWAHLYGLWYSPAEKATGVVTVSGNIGAVLPAGTALQYTQDQVFSTTSDLVLTATSSTVDVAAESAGVAGNVPAGINLTLLSPVSGINSTVLVSSPGIAGGEDEGDLDDLRAQVYRRMSEPPQGGSSADYVTWALASHASITRAWVTEHEQGSGSVVVRMVCDNNADPIPSGAVVAACETYISKCRPAGRRSVYVLPPVAAPINYRIRTVPNTAQVHAAVEAELRDLHRRDAVPGGGLLLSRIREAVSIAAGESDNSVLYPTESPTTETGKLLTVGSIEWVL